MTPKNSKIKKRIYEFDEQLFQYFSKVGYFPDGNNGGM